MASENKLGVQGYIPRIAIPYYEETFEERCHNDVWSVTRMIAFKDEIDKIPAADVSEVKHGKWIEEEDGYDHVFYSCSVCNAGICTIDETPIEYGWKYCPECGSKMEELVRLHEDEEDEDDD